jgi:hypothetical protein
VEVKMFAIKRIISGGREDVALEDLLAEAKGRHLDRICVVRRDEDGGDEKVTGFYETQCFPDLVEDRDPSWDRTWALLGKELEDSEWEVWWTSQLTGHMYFGAAHETDNSCGNCDGARCEDINGDPWCRRIYHLDLRQVYREACRQCPDAEDPMVTGARGRPCFMCKGTQVVRRMA